MAINGQTAAYVRRSTYEQENEHQLNAIEQWTEENDVPLDSVEFFSETASGASRSREKLKRLMESVEADEVDHVVVWELSRIAREGKLAQEFFDLCEEHNVTVHVTSGSIRKIQPDGSNRFVADILAAVYAEERRTLIQRSKWGQQRALKQNKWVGKPPLGFTTDDDGYLIPNIEFYGEDYNPDRDGFFAVEEAMRMIHEEDASFRSIARDMICSRRALSNVYNDEERRRWFFEREADDERVQAALDELDTEKGYERTAETPG